MKYLLTKFHITPQVEEQLQPSRDLLADICGECGYESFEDTDDGLNGYIQQDHYSDIALEEALKDFPIDGVTIIYSTEEIPDQNWNEAWEEIGFQPICVAGKLTIYDARHTDDPEQFSTPINIGIQARNAFGTGTHETTRMMVGTLMELPLEGTRVLDCGCGTGILSIAALMMGASEAVGYDIDEWSVDNARHNAALNGVDDRFEALLGDASALSHVSGVFDVVVANINRNILFTDMPHFRDVVNIGATIVISGFYTEDAAMLVKKAAEMGLQEVGRKIENNWCCIRFEVG